MAQPYPIQSSFSGMARDYSRDQLPSGYVWNMQDFFPNMLGAPLRKRGGWAYASSALGSTARVARVAYADFSAGAQLLAVEAASAGYNLWNVASSASAASVAGLSAMGTAVGSPVFYANRLIFPNTDGSTTIYSYTGGTVTALSGTTPAPTGKYAAVYKDRVILAGTSALPKRAYFSAAGDPTTWDTTNGWVDVSRPITGLAALRNALLVMSNTGTERLRGSSPPPGSDFVLEKVSDYGCIDYKSIALWNDRAIYADTNGIYITDGSASSDLTAVGLIQNYWRTLLASYTTSWRLVGGVFRNFYFMSVNDGTNFQDCLVCDLLNRTWFRLQNCNFSSFVEAKGTFQNFYAGMQSSNRVVNLTGLFSPAAANKNDGDGTAVTPVVELPAVRGFSRFHRRWIQASGLTHWRRLYLSYDMRDAATDDPTLTLSYVTTPESSSYTSITPTVAESTAWNRVGRSFGPSGARGGKIIPLLGLKVAQTNASSDTRLYLLEGEYETIEQSALDN